MYDNTFEWCREWYHSKLPGGVDPDLDLYLAKANSSVRRDGCWPTKAGPVASPFVWL
jgi:hypothetical protein